jgi:peptidoglycan/LPS O-acetylase OafA/YrhL
VHQWFGITAPNLVSWSISVEFASYILFPLYVAAFARLRRYWPLFVLPVGIVAAQFFPHERLIRGMAEFLVGCSVYGLQHNYRFRFRLPFISLLAFAIPFAAFGVLGHEMLWLAIVGFSVVVFCLATDTSSDWLCRFCAWRPVAFIGDISYSIYLLQWSVWATWKHLGPRVPFLAGHNYLIISLAILNVVAVAAASFFWFEKPTRTWLRKALSSRPVPDVSVATTKTP